MQRLKAMMVSLLPVLVLAVAGLLVIQVQAGRAGQDGAFVAKVGLVAEQGISHEVPWLERTAHAATQHVLRRCGRDSVPEFVGARNQELVGTRISQYNFISPEGPPGLAQHWQFSFRAALEARAPSSAS